MKHITRLPLALAAISAATPAMAHDTGFFHTHGEGLAIGAVVVAVIGGFAAWKLIAARARK